MSEPQAAISTSADCLQTIKKCMLLHAARCSAALSANRRCAQAASDIDIIICGGGRNRVGLFSLAFGYMNDNERRHVGNGSRTTDAVTIPHTSRIKIVATPNAQSPWALQALIAFLKPHQPYTNMSQNCRCFLG